MGNSPRRIRLVAFENGVGNSRDVVLLQDALERLGCQVEVDRVGRWARRRRRWHTMRWLARYRCRRAFRDASVWHATIHLEHIWPERIGRSRYDIVLPNPEWFDRCDRALLPLIRQVWTKTPAATRALHDLMVDARLVGFTSVDRYAPAEARHLECLHLAGRSRMKGTADVLAAWQQHPEWPLLHLVHDLPDLPHTSPASNVRVHDGRLTDAQLQQLQNRCQIHLCPSQTEGWGHYLVEAAAVGAEIVTIDGAPMNELLPASRAHLAAATAVRRQHLADCYQSNPDALAIAMQAALRAATGCDPAKGPAARSWYESLTANFTRAIGRQLEELLPRSGTVR